MVWTEFFSKFKVSRRQIPVLCGEALHRHERECAKSSSMVSRMASSIVACALVKRSLLHQPSENTMSLLSSVILRTRKLSITMLALRQQTNCHVGVVFAAVVEKLWKFAVIRIRRRLRSFWAGAFCKFA